jgi:hydroxypyruvate reductase
VADGPRALLYDLTSAALAAVEGRAAVRRALAARPIERPCRVVAIGKAAPAMALGAVDRLGARLTRALVVTKQGHATAELAQQIARLEIVESGHPMPNAASLTAGTAVLRAVDATPADELLLFLISGGASSLADVLAPGIDLELLARANAWLLGSGLPIGAINAVRARLSQLKGGQLASRLGDRPWRALMISDVPRDDPAVIGSGLLMTSGRDSRLPSDLPDWLRAALGRAGDAPVPRPAPTSASQITIVARPEDALEAVRTAARARGLETEACANRFAGDAARLGADAADRLQHSSAEVVVAVGESTVQLPERPGRGGRCQHVALAAACALADRAPAALLIVGTDGTDGPTEDAGALVDEGTVARGRDAGLDERACLARAAAGEFLEASGDLINTGPTGTNVCDLLIGLTTRGRARLEAEARASGFTAPPQ